MINNVVDIQFLVQVQGNVQTLPGTSKSIIPALYQFTGLKGLVTCTVSPPTLDGKLNLRRGKV